LKQSKETISSISKGKQIPNGKLYYLLFSPFQAFQKSLHELNHLTTNWKTIVPHIHISMGLDKKVKKHGHLFASVLFVSNY